jgi:hypothetical protein
MFLALSLVSSALAGAPTYCDLYARHISSVVDTDGYQTTYDLEHDGYDPVPLLARAVYVSSESCVMAEVSLHTFGPYGRPLLGDEYAAIKVTIDGNPMYGHITGCTTMGVNVPCITLEAQNDGVTPTNSHSYHLVMPGVTEGWHRVEVFYAGLDNPDTMESNIGAYVGGSVLTVFHQ